MKHSSNRASQELTNSNTIDEYFYTDYIQLHYPESFSKKFIELANKNKINIACLEKDMANEWALKSSLFKSHRHSQANEINYQT